MFPHLRPYMNAFLFYLFRITFLTQICAQTSATAAAGAGVPLPSDDGAVKGLVPRTSIECDGKIPSDWKWPAEFRVHGAPPTTPQQLCTLFRYGGHEYYNLGGYCEPRLSSSRDDLWRTTLPNNLDRIYFDTAQNKHPLVGEFLVGNDRAYNFCQLRCWCRTVGPVHPLDQSAKPIYLNSERTIPMDLDTEVYWGVQRQPTGGHNGNVLAVSIRTKRLEDPSVSRITERHLSLKNGNKITCSGPAYPWDLPIPSPPTSSLNTLTGLCRAALSGGTNDFNAGGVCITPMIGDPEVNFLDEFTPYTALHSTSWVASTSVRVYCYIHCRCVSADPSILERERPVGFLKQAKYDLSEGGLSITMTQGKNAGNTYVLNAKVGNEANGDHRDAGSCYTADGQACDQPLPEDLYTSLGGGASASLGLSGFETVKSVCKHGCVSCGRSCNSNRECGAGGDCSCIVPRRGQPLQDSSGGGNRFAVAICLSVAQYLAIEARTGGRRTGGLLGKRSKSQSLSSAGNLTDEVFCACNSTYVSTSCCGVTDGIIWEQSGRSTALL